MSALEFAQLEPRQFYGSCRYSSDPDCYNNSTWDRWARWLVLGLIILGAVVLFFVFSCVSARRRRKRGYTPFRGTGWAAGRPPPGHGPATYNQHASPYHGNQAQSTPHNGANQPYYGGFYGNNNGAQGPAPGGPAQPPPAYGQSQSYYGQRDDMELQPPAQTYQPPTGPPPGKEDGIIR